MLSTRSDSPYTSIKDLLARLKTLHQPFACIYRPLSDSADKVLLLEGNVEPVKSMSDLSMEMPPLSESQQQGLYISQLILLPFNQLKDRGYACIDDKETALVMYINRQTYYPINQLIDAIEETKSQALNTRFDLDDQEYGKIVGTIIDDEINTGEGSNFVISRSIEGDIANFSLNHVLTLFKRALETEQGSYWTWMIYTGDRYFIGSTPEQHIQITDNHIAMNPISGTLRYPDEQKLEQALYDFLQDEKECNELFMVVDEELKMMSNICHTGIKVSGPKLKMMSHIAHTEYFIEGESQRPLEEILKYSLFAPTVTGSPIENACKVIARHELRGRGYYSGVVALTGINQGKRYLDSAILIRTADISLQGHFRLTAGSTIVKDSIPQNEAEETRAKLHGLMDAFFGLQERRPHSQKSVLSPKIMSNIEQLLAQRNQLVSTFWLGNVPSHHQLSPLSVTIALIDMEDTFTEMIAYQLGKMGCIVSIIPWYDVTANLPDLKDKMDKDILFIGPGPGDPTNIHHEKMRVARDLISHRLTQNLPLIGTCLGHQLICMELGIPIIRLPKNRQGSQYKVTFHDNSFYAAFYNSFSAIHNTPQWNSTLYEKTVHLERLGKNEVIALSAKGVSSIQFHSESFLTQDAFSIYQWLISNVLKKESKQ